MSSNTGVVDNNSYAKQQQESPQIHRLLPKQQQQQQGKQSHLPMNDGNNNNDSNIIINNDNNNNNNDKSDIMVRAMKGKLAIGAAIVMVEFGITWHDDEDAWNRMLTVALQKSHEGMFSCCDTFPENNVDMNHWSPRHVAAKARLLKNLLLVNWVAVQIFLYGHSNTIRNHSNNSNNTNNNNGVNFMAPHRKIKLEGLLHFVQDAQIFGAVKAISDSQFQRSIQHSQINAFLKEQLDLAKQGKITLKAAKGLVARGITWEEEDYVWKTNYASALWKYNAEYQRIVHLASPRSGAWDDPALGVWMSVQTFASRIKMLCDERANQITALVVRFKQLHEHKLKQTAAFSLSMLRTPSQGGNNNNNDSSSNNRNGNSSNIISSSHDNEDNNNNINDDNNQRHHYGINHVNYNTTVQMNHEAGMHLPSDAAAAAQGREGTGDRSERSAKQLLEMIGIGSLGMEYGDSDFGSGYDMLYETSPNLHHHPGSPSSKRAAEGPLARNNHHPVHPGFPTAGRSQSGGVAWISIETTENAPNKLKPSGPPPSVTVEAKKSKPKNKKSNPKKGTKKAVVTPTKKTVAKKSKRPTKASGGATDTKKEKKKRPAIRGNLLAKPSEDEDDDAEVGVLVLDDYFDWGH